MKWAIRTSTSRRIASLISPPMRLEYEGRDRVRVFGIEGRPATDFYKVSISYSAGYKAVGTLVYSWPDAYDKAQAADKILRARLDRLG